MREIVHMTHLELAKYRAEYAAENQGDDETRRRVACELKCTNKDLTQAIAAAKVLDRLDDDILERLLRSRDVVPLTIIKLGKLPNELIRPALTRGAIRFGGEVLDKALRLSIKVMA